MIFCFVFFFKILSTMKCQYHQSNVKHSVSKTSNAPANNRFPRHKDLNTTYYTGRDEMSLQTVLRVRLIKNLETTPRTQECPSLPKAEMMSNQITIRKNNGTVSSTSSVGPFEYCFTQFSSYSTHGQRERTMRRTKK